MRPLETRSSSDPWGLETGLSLLAQRWCGDSNLHFARARSEPAERLGHLLCVVGRLIKEDPDVGVHKHADRQAQEVLCGEGQDRVGRKSTERSRQSCHHASPTSANTFSAGNKNELLALRSWSRQFPSLLLAQDEQESGAGLIVHLESSKGLQRQ